MFILLLPYVCVSVHSWFKSLFIYICDFVFNNIDKIQAKLFHKCL